MQSFTLPLVPLPRSLIRREGSLRLPAGSRLALSFAPGLGSVAAYLQREVASRYPFTCVEGGASGTAVQLEDAGAPEASSPEAYGLSVTPQGFHLRAQTAAGAFRAAQTLLQLLPLEGGELPCLEIEDGPRFAWRGLMLDCSRHFMPKAELLRFLDLMAFHKLNVFHWHFIDDQGWRFEVKAYPRLTEVGAWRAGSPHGHARVSDRIVPVPHGGFYSQADCREIVAYAAERQIEVVPEIEMPGHAQAALAAYPFLACVEEPLSVSCRWGIHQNVMNPGKEEVFTFLETVLGEAADLFPSRYLHVGGDECPKEQWECNPLCRERMRQEGLEDGQALQGWFMRRIDRFLHGMDRTLIGWDEILEGGLAPHAAVMSWRGIEGGVAAARAGHEVVMTPNRSLYFDYYQGDPRYEPLAIGGLLPLETVYAYDPVPGSLEASEARRILGAQANLWTEYIPDLRQVEYMTLPRAAALAERVWSPPENKDFGDFLRRLRPLRGHYDARGWFYRSRSFEPEEWPKAPPAGS